MWMWQIMWCWRILRILDYENCICRKKLVDKLVAECTENIDEVKLAKTTLAKHENECESCYTLYIALFLIIFNF